MYLEVPAARVHPRCANAHNCFGLSLGRWKTSEVNGWTDGNGNGNGMTDGQTDVKVEIVI